MHSVKLMYFLFIIALNMLCFNCSFFQTAEGSKIQHIHFLGADNMQVNALSFVNFTIFNFAVTMIR